MAFLDEGPLKKEFLLWAKKREIYTPPPSANKEKPSAYPPVLELYHALFFKGCTFFDYTWRMVEATRGEIFWRRVVENLDYIMIACGFNTLKILEDDYGCHENGPLCTNYFAFSNELLIEYASFRDNETGNEILMKDLLSYMMENIFKSPEQLVLDILYNSASFFSEGCSNLSRLLNNFKKSPSIGIFNPVTSRISDGRNRDLSVPDTMAVCDKALKIIPTFLKKVFGTAASEVLEYSVKTIVNRRPALMLTDTEAVNPSNVQQEIFARALAFSAVWSGDGGVRYTERGFVSSADAEGKTYRVISGHNMKYNWSVYGNYFGCIAHYTSAVNIRTYRSILSEKISSIGRNIEPWNENTLFKVSIAAVWYTMIFYNGVTAEKAYELVFEKIKKWKIN